MKRPVTLTSTLPPAHYRFAELQATRLGMSTESYLAALMVCALDDVLFDAEQEITV